MEQWEQWQRAEQVALKQRQAQELEAVSCKTCGSQWFEQVRYVKVKADHMCIPGQEVPTVEPGLPPYILLRCVRCENQLQPRIQGQTYGHDIASKSYANFLDTAEGKLDSREGAMNDEERMMILERKVKKLEEKLNAVQGKE